MTITRMTRAAALVAVAILAAPSAWAETRISINGADQQPLAEILNGTTHAQWLADSVNIGANWTGIPTATLVDYPASLIAPSADTSINIGQANLNSDILNAASTGQPVVVTGLSMGTIVIDREIAQLDTDPSAPRPGKLTFIEFGTPSAPGSFGATYIPAGATVPLINYTQEPLPANSPYNIVIVNAQWDGWANAPDRPWDLIADANAVLGALQEHGTDEVGEVPAKAVEQSSVTNSAGGTTTTYVVPEPTLPLMQPLVRAGVPSFITTPLNNVLTRIVEAGYSKYTPNLGPYVSGGKLVLNQTTPSLTPAKPAITTMTPKPPAATVSPAKVTQHK